jgi:hypothetical protein
MSIREDNAYFTPVNEETTKQLYDLFVSESEVGYEGQDVQEIEIPVMMGRTLKVLARGRSCFVTFPGKCDDCKSLYLFFKF